MLSHYDSCKVSSMIQDSTQKNMFRKEEQETSEKAVCMFYGSSNHVRKLLESRKRRTKSPGCSQIFEKPQGVLVTLSRGSRMKGGKPPKNKKRGSEVVPIAKPLLSFPCAMDRVHALLDAWMKNGEITLPHLTQRPPGSESKCRYHRTTSHPTKDCLVRC